MRLLPLPALILFLALRAPGADADGIVVHPLGAIDVPATDAARVTNVLGAALTAALPFTITSEPPPAGLTGLDLFQSAAARRLATPDAARIGGVVVRSPEGARVIQIIAWRDGESGPGLGLPVPWPDDAPVPADAILQEAVRAVGPVAVVAEVVGSGPRRRVRLQPSLPLPPGAYYACRRSPDRGPSALGPAAATVVLRRTVDNPMWVEPTRVTGSLRPGLVLCPAARGPVPWPSSATGLVIEHSSPGSLVSIDGVFAGVAPLLAALSPGRCTVELRSPAGGREIATGCACQVARRLGQERAVETTVNAGRLVVRSQPDDAEVLLDDVAVGRTPFVALDPEPGKHRLTVRGSGRKIWSAEVDFAPGKTTEIEVHLAPLDDDAPATARVAAGTDAAEAPPRRSEPLAEARNLSLGQAGAHAAEALSLPILPTKGAPRVRMARVLIQPVAEDTVRCAIVMDDGLPEGTHVTPGVEMVSVVIPDAIVLDVEKSKCDVNVGGVTTVVAGRQSARERTVRVQVEILGAARAEVREDGGNGRVDLDITLPPADPAPPQQHAETPPGDLWFEYPTPYKKIALTFDDFPSPGRSEALLAALKDHGAPATFFVIGRKAVKDPWLLRHARRDGHVLGNHSYNHKRLVGLDSMEVYREVERCSAAMEEILGNRPVYFRPPGGRHNALVRRVVRSAGMRLVMWDASSPDYEEPPPAKIVRDVLKTARDRHNVIVDLHDGHLATIKAIPDLVHQLRLRGYRLVTLDHISFH